MHKVVQSVSKFSTVTTSFRNGYDYFKSKSVVSFLLKLSHSLEFDFEIDITILETNCYSLRLLKVVVVQQLIQKDNEVFPTPENNLICIGSRKIHKRFWQSLKGLSQWDFAKVSWDLYDLTNILCYGFYNLQGAVKIPWPIILHAKCQISIVLYYNNWINKFISKMELAPRRICWSLIGADDAWSLKGRVNRYRRPHLQALPLLSIIIWI